MKIHFRLELMKRLITYLFLSVALCYFLVSFNTDKPKPYQLSYNLNFSDPYIPNDNPLTIEGVELGRFLFYDPILSGNNEQSCSSCHKQELAFGDGLSVSIGAQGGTVNKNSIGLLNLAWDYKYFWDGRVNSLEDLMISPITHPNEMNQDTSSLIKELKEEPRYVKLFNNAFPTEGITFKTVSKALAQFVRTIITKGVTLPDGVLPAKFKKGEGPDPMEIEGYMKEASPRGVFFRFSAMCSKCHDKPIYGGSGMAYNGVKMNDTIKKLKIPSLINVMLTPPYMHDGRFKTIKEVLLHYQKNIDSLHVYNPRIFNDPIKNLITDYDIEHADDFFKYLTDSSILQNINLSSPFAKVNDSKSK